MKKAPTMTLWERRKNMKKARKAYVPFLIKIDKLFVPNIPKYGY